MTFPERVIQRAGLYRFLLYVPESDEEIVQAFIQLCRSRGLSASGQLIEFMKTQLPTRMEPVRQILNCHLCDKMLDKNQLFEFMAASGRRLRACEPCFTISESKGLVRRLIKRPEPFNPNLSHAEGLGEIGETKGSV